ncbi:Cof-like hydrolase [Marvinbryantia formatexigens DSM 14469]|uniref:Cof-like hydrolase n=1 Tax=Marvinbryantia formatexigens DSM 14469 TaxID=478749 RepID=C6LKM9_9FIRM|nr:Cof-type HAD-IIB family hydrolase [Marvinbryantia formatexigens]EET58766.1 Cof-like hydrolase [Marvinbryantia formatexigens DSM 14469]UWO24112.1 Cof-type HAD-IIB family hydrolase [Marvinbryantia formatexigens DSM 14469]SDG69101.1 hypothetical protein SAMN05660368_03065 [Marvinbryantia formatexigens]
MMHDKKILFLDLDGTLLNDEKEITPGNMAAIREALRQGHKIVITSGRATISALKFAKKMSLTSEGCYAITYNGACIYDLCHQKPIYRKTLAKDIVRYLLEAAEKAGLYAHTYTRSAVLSAHNTRELLSYTTATTMDYLIVEDVCQALPEEPEKVIIINLDEPQRLHDFQKSLAGWAEGKADSFFSCPNYLEYMPVGVSKGSAVRIFCDMFDIPPENTISAGDADNDIPMLEATHISAIMKNADASMRAHGNYVTEHDNNHDAVAEIIYKFILTNGEN